MEQTNLNIGTQGTQIWSLNEVTQDRLKAVTFNATELDSKRLAEFNILGQIISPRLGFNLRPVSVRFVVDKWHGFMFPSDNFGYPLLISLQKSSIFTQLCSPTFLCVFFLNRLSSIPVI